MTRFPSGSRTALALAVLLVALFGPLLGPAGPAQACACAYSPIRGGTATVAKETALVRSAGDGTEDVYLALTVDSDVRTGALLFPVPDRHTWVSAGPGSLFAELPALTQVRTTPNPGHGADGDGAGAPAQAPVVVEKRQANGPLDVVTLTATHAAALDTWLGRDEFTPKPAIAQIAGSYIARGWSFVAVRLRPACASTTHLNGQLDPLHLHFDTSSLVYPMRLSHLACEAEVRTLRRERRRAERSGRLGRWDGSAGSS